MHYVSVQLPCIVGQRFCHLVATVGLWLQMVVTLGCQCQWEVPIVGANCQLLIGKCPLGVRMLNCGLLIQNQTSKYVLLTNVQPKAPLSLESYRNTSWNVNREVHLHMFVILLAVCLTCTNVWSSQSARQQQNDWRSQNRRARCSPTPETGGCTFAHHVLRWKHIAHGHCHVFSFDCTKLV